MNVQIIWSNKVFLEEMMRKIMRFLTFSRSIC